VRKPAKRKLKVIAAQFGFHDTVVAAPSQAAAPKRPLSARGAYRKTGGRD
jgi:hypothetical protein